MWNPRSHRLVTRALALLLSCVLTLTVATDAFGLDPCPHHGVPAPTHSVTSAADEHAMPHGTMSHAAMPDHAMPDHAVSHGATAQHDAQHNTGHGVCTCMGECATTATVPVPAAHVINAVITIGSATPIESFVAEAPASPYLAFLPYSQAPPLDTVLS